MVQLDHFPGPTQRSARLEVALASSLSSDKEESVAKDVIGLDQRKRLHGVVVIKAKGTVIARRQFGNSTEGFRELKVF